MNPNEAADCLELQYGSQISVYNSSLTITFILLKDFLFQIASIEGFPI